LALAGLRLRPAPKEQIEFFFSPDEFQPARVKSLEAAFHRSLTQGHPGAHRPRDALQVLCPKVIKLEQIANKLPGALRDDHAVRLCNALQPCRKVRRLTDDGLLLRSTGAYQVADHHQSSRNTDASLEGSVRLEATYRSDQFQTCAHGPLCVVLMGLWVAEVDEDTVTHVLRHAPKRPTVSATHFW
jgi:hypothetical protein